MSDEAVPVLDDTGARPRLVGRRCGACDEVLFPPRDRCPSCGGADLKDVRFAPAAELESFTIVHVPQSGFEAPYAVGYVRLTPGLVRVFTPIAGGADDIAIGTTVYPTTLTPETAGVPEPMWGFTAGEER